MSATTAAIGVLRRVYNSTIRKRLPTRLGVKNGVAVRADRLLDATWVDQSVEAPAVAAITEHVRSDDNVVVIGGGWGVTPVHAARQGAEVTVFEAAKTHVDIVKDTAQLNQVGEMVTVEHAIIGDAVDVWGDDVGESKAPADLPPCEVLEIDAEGAELSILSELTVRPRVVVVEFHPHLGVSEADTRAQLSDLGYTVVSRGVEDPGKAIVVAAVRGER